MNVNAHTPIQVTHTATGQHTTPTVYSLYWTTELNQMVFKCCLLCLQCK